MFKHETFPNAPITEALIDLRVTLDESAALESLEQLAEQLSDRFPNRQTRFEHTHEVAVEDKVGIGETRSKSRVTGYTLFSEGSDKAVLIRVNGFTFSKLKPYANWDTLREEAQELWETYRAILEPKSIGRLAVRYINRIELPLPIEKFDDYILTVPQIAEGVPQGISELFCRMVLPSPEHGVSATVTSTFERPEKDGAILPYIFDIDAFVPVDLEPMSNEIWPTFEKLRDYKNEIFFLSMTEKSKELFR